MSRGQREDHLPLASLEDVQDVGLFAMMAVRRTFSGMTLSERADADLEALVQIYELHKTWDPARSPSFAAFLATYLPKRLVSWFRTELRQSGRGRWSGSTNEYRLNGCVSLDEPRLGAGARNATADGDVGRGAPQNRHDSALIVHGPEE